ncbi:hypothetical protein HMI55_000873 [Coelomomyces lativittatus]|nr:hypothetical protein HMI55_000873 [Coelomomyces lativittatus]
MMYFLKDPNVLLSSPQEILKHVQYGTIARSILDSLVELMNGIYVPLFIDNRGWPDAVRKDFAGQLHKFMAILTDAAFHSKGHTVLYVPKEKIINLTEGKYLSRRLTGR